MELNPILTIDVGGQRFKVLRETVMKCPNSLLAQVISGKDIFNMLVADGAYFFDRNPQYFLVVLDYMRTGKIFMPPSLLEEQLREELVFWKIDCKSYQEIQSKPMALDPTLVIPSSIEPTLLIPDQIEKTLVESTQPIEPTLIIEDENLLKNKDEPLKNSITNFIQSTQNLSQPKKDVKKIDLNNDDLLTSLLPETNRTLPWSSKNTKASEPKEAKEKKQIKEKIVNAKTSANDSEKAKNNKKNNKKKESESEDDFGYELSFIDDEDDDNLAPKKRKKTKAPAPTKQLKNSAASKCKKNPSLNIEELSKALKK